MPHQDKEILTEVWREINLFLQNEINKVHLFSPNEINKVQPFLSKLSGKWKGRTRRGPTM
jgi:hypothetical protein